MKLAKLGIALFLSNAPFIMASAASVHNDASKSMSYVYVSERGVAGNVGVCSVDPKTGVLTKCDDSAVVPKLKFPEGVTANPAGSKLYIVNNTPKGRITMCDISAKDGFLHRCKDAGGSDFFFPDAAAFSPDGSIIYVINGLPAKGSSTTAVTACSVDSKTGLLSDCVQSLSDTLKAPAWIDLNTAGTLAYIANFGGNTVSVCAVNGKSLSNCNDTSGAGFNLPDSVTIHTTSAGKELAYISNNGTMNILVCSVDTGSGLLGTCASAPTDSSGGFTSAGISFNPSGSVAYIANFFGDDKKEGAITVCSVNPATGLLSKCSKTTAFSAMKRISGIATNTITKK